MLVRSIISDPFYIKISALQPGKTNFVIPKYVTPRVCVYSRQRQRGILTIAYAN
jgi:hypothetical protein